MVLILLFMCLLLCVCNPNIIIALGYGESGKFMKIMIIIAMIIGQPKQDVFLVGFPLLILLSLAGKATASQKDQYLKRWNKHMDYEMYDYYSYTNRRKRER